MAELLAALRQAVGQPNVLTRATHGDLSAWENDWRKRWPGHARAVVRPGNTEEVAAVVKACTQHGVALVPQGGNTGLVGGSGPDGTGTQVVLSLQRMHRVRGLDAANATLTVEAGCVLQAVQQAARDAGFLFPLSLAAEGSCTIGGNLATNAGGTQVLRFGNARDLCLGIEAVTASGEVVNLLSGLRKDNTGYDLRNLLVGSEGTLGIITAATLKLFPLPAAQLTAWVAVPSMAAAVSLLGTAQRLLGPALTGFEVMNAFSLSLVARHMPQLTQPLAAHADPWRVLLEVQDVESEAHAQARLEAVFEVAMANGCASDAAVAQSVAQSRHFWHLRESIPLAQAEEGTNIKHDISLPVSAIPAFVEATDAALAQAIEGVRLVNFGHLGDGNLHYNVQAPPGVSAAEFLAAQEAVANAIVYQAVAQHGGSISAEHGVGWLKRDELPHYKDATALAWMRQIKRALDPANLLNPGRVLRTD
jgi:FAD/FMN-containing dehydrogenase